MVLTNRNLVTIDDFSDQEIEAVFAIADEMDQSIREGLGLCSNFIMATLFYEPSTRTRLSFEAAMHRLGGRVISCSEMQYSSHAKGESLADTARVVGSYADIVVIRHPWEGSAKVAAEYSEVPVVNAGDGGHEHPTQTLCDLYTLKKERGKIKGLSVALWGDLKYGRTVHSLAYGLARFGADIVCLPAEGMEMPDYVSTRLQQEYNCRLIQGSATDADHIIGDVDAVYLSPTRHHQSQLHSSRGISGGNNCFNSEKEKVRIDALYMTRLQREKHAEVSVAAEGEKNYPRVTPELLKGAKFKRTLIMHPLPRVDELPHEVDQDPRSVYFKQAAWGVPVRMALIALLLGVKDSGVAESYNSQQHKMSYPLYKRSFGMKCASTSCVTVHESKYVVPEFKIVSSEPLRLRCVYCEQEIPPQYIASAKRHQPTLQNKRYHKADSLTFKKIKPENLIFFDSEKEALAQGFRPGRHADT